MNEDTLERLKAIDPGILTDIVRQDQKSPSFEITEWSIKRLSDKGMVNPDGLWLVTGSGSTGSTPRQWSVVVKILNRSNQETATDARIYWKRELLVAQSGLSERLRGPVRAPRFYRTEEFQDYAWLWMEHVEDGRSSAWTLDDYVFAARQLGRWSGNCLSMPFPSDPWLAKQHYR